MRALGPAHRLTIESQSHLANTLSNLGRFADAERLASTAATEGAKSLGERSLEALTAHDAHAVALLGLRRADDAERILRRQLAILEARKEQGEDVGEGEELTTNVRVHLGMALAALGRRVEAEALLVEGVPRLAPRDAGTKRALRFVADFYEEWNRAEPDPDRAARAAEWRRRLEAFSGPAVAQ